mgnify:FL=1
MPDDSMVPVTDDLVARLRDRINGTGVWRTAPVRDEDMQALADRITTLERELADAHALRHKAEFHAGVLEAQNVVLRRELVEAQEACLPFPGNDEGTFLGRSYWDATIGAFFDDRTWTTKFGASTEHSTLRRCDKLWRFACKKANSIPRTLDEGAGMEQK